MTLLKNLRKESGRLQTDIAAEADITREYLSSLENGRNRITRQMAEKMAGIYGVSPVDILGYEIPENERNLREEWDGDRNQAESLRQEHAREVQTLQREIEACQSRLDQALDSLDFAQSMCIRLQKQNEALVRRVEELEKRDAAPEKQTKTLPPTQPSGENA